MLLFKYSLVLLLMLLTITSHSTKVCMTKAFSFKVLTRNNNNNNTLTRRFFISPYSRRISRNNNNHQFDIVMNHKRSSLRAFTSKVTSSSITTDRMDKSIINEEIIIQCTDGMQLAAKRWQTILNNDNNNDSPKIKILCLHGWLDNAASFNMMAPVLASKLHAEVVALDFPGHGLSSHKSADGPSQLLSEYALYVAETLTQLKWISDNDNQNNNKEAKITLIGHSMGAGVSTIFAATYPETIKRLVLLDGLGPLARKSNNVSQHIRNAIEQRMASNKTLYPSFSNGESIETIPNNSPFIGKRKYPNLDRAIKTRIMTATASPGKQYISKEAATALVCRASVPADEDINIQKAGGLELDESYDGSVYFRHDARLYWPSLQYFTQEQVNALLADIRCPTCVLVAEDGWPFDSEQVEKSINILKPCVLKKLPGSHHFHMDPDNASQVSSVVTDFLREKL